MNLYDEKYLSPLFPTFGRVSFQGTCFCLETARKILLIRSKENDDEGDYEF